MLVPKPVLTFLARDTDADGHATLLMIPASPTEITFPRLRGYTRAQQDAFTAGFRVRTTVNTGFHHRIHLLEAHAPLAPDHPLRAQTHPVSASHVLQMFMSDDRALANSARRALQSTVTELSNVQLAMWCLGHNELQGERLRAADDDFTCPICLGAQEPDTAYCWKTACAHTFHEHCLLKWHDVDPNCPMCREPLV